MNLESRLVMQLSKKGEKWVIRYATRAGSMISTEALAHPQTRELPADVMQCIKAMVLAGELSSNIGPIDRRISEIYHKALVKGKKHLKDFEELLDQVG